MFLAKEKGRLGDMKWFVKAPIKYVPGIGWGMAFLDCLFVERDWAADRASIEHTFESLVKGDVPVWLISFVEGTRITPKKLTASQNYARDKGLEPTQHVMLPRTKGFVATVTGLRDHVAAVYDVTIGYPDGVPTMWQYVKGASRQAHLHVRRFAVESLPQGEAELSNWLIDRYREKDDLLEHFYQCGAFPG
jgi:1-acyl-sn-glycerol-3-phosphate acyltransferase